MPSCDAETFVPLGGTSGAPGFRPFGTPASTPAHDAPAAPAPDPYALAFEAGRAEGRAEAAADRAVLGRDVGTALAAIAAWRQELRVRYTHALVALALETARKIAGEALEASPERWVPIVAAAIGRLVDREQVRVRVSPALAAVLRAHTTMLAAGGGDVRIVEDATLDGDACRVESTGGDVECGVAAQLAAVAEALDGRVG